jgi:predicted RNase H-like HicB family nuclease
MTSRPIEARSDLERYMLFNYATEVVEDRCDDRLCYMASNPELPGLMAQGDSVEEAVSSLEEARRDYISALLAQGLEIPLPKQVGTITQQQRATGLEIVGELRFEEPTFTAERAYPPSPKPTVTGGMRSLGQQTFNFA